MNTLRLLEKVLEEDAPTIRQDLDGDLSPLIAVAYEYNVIYNYFPGYWKIAISKTIA